MVHDQLDDTVPHETHGHEKLVRMANQIATFFLSQPESVRTNGVATHINKFWEPRMRRHLFEHLDTGGAGLLPLVIEASTLIRRPGEPDRPGMGTKEGTTGGISGR